MPPVPKRPKRSSTLLPLPPLPPTFLTAFHNLLNRYPSTRLRPTLPCTTNLTLAALTTLVEWKLHTGTFRPSLLGLIKQNTEATVQETTARAFEHIKDTETAIAELCKLKGVGPATASLILAVKDPKETPFFSDPVFALTYGEDVKPKYQSKEYKGIIERTKEIQKEIDVTAEEIEKAAFVYFEEKKLGEELPPV